MNSHTYSTHKPTFASRKFDQCEIYRIINFIVKSIEENNEITTKELRTALSRELSLDVKPTMLFRLRRDLGYAAKSVKNGQLIRERNREKRLLFCKEMLRINERFNDVVFADESTVQLENNSKSCYVRVREENRRIKSRAKHPVKVHIWAGISSQGATPIVIFDGNARMDSRLYCKIIRDYYLPFAESVFKGRCRLAQDNDPKHTSQFTSKHLDQWKIERLEWPPESPDLNPIEFVWHQLKHFLR
ncbi:hypothetical protein Aduo_015888 [Ancylostoma duodenale]